MPLPKLATPPPLPHSSSTDRAVSTCPLETSSLATPNPAGLPSVAEAVRLVREALHTPAPASPRELTTPTRFRNMVEKALGKSVTTEADTVVAKINVTASVLLSTTDVHGGDVTILQADPATYGRGDVFIAQVVGRPVRPINSRGEGAFDILSSRSIETTLLTGPAALHAFVERNARTWNVIENAF